MEWKQRKKTQELCLLSLLNLTHDHSRGGFLIFGQFLVILLVVYQRGATNGTPLRGEPWWNGSKGRRREKNACRLYSALAMTLEGGF